MSWVDCFKAGNVSEMVRTFDTHTILYYANKALGEQPDNQLIKVIKRSLEDQLNKDSLLKDIEAYLTNPRREVGLNKPRNPGGKEL